MKKQYHLLSILALISVGTFAQHTANNKTDIAYQKTLKLDNPASKESAMSQFAKMYNLKEGNTYQTIRTTTDVSGMSHERIQQYYKGIKVEFGTAITHTRDGFVETINGELYDAKNVNLVPSLTPQEGFELALKDSSAEKYLWEDSAQAILLDYKKPQGELVIFPNVNTGEIKLAFKYDIYAMKPISRDYVYVDAHSGEILFKNPIIKHADKLISKKETERYAKKIEEITLEGNSVALATGTAATRYSGSRSIETTQTGPTAYVLNENTRGTGNGVVTYNAQKNNVYGTINFTDANNSWTEYANVNKDNAALDAHWGAEMTYDFWKNVFNRNSYDDAGAKIISHVHFDDVPGGAGYGNAFWNGSVMTYGDGGSAISTFNNPLTALDVCGHEIGHAICTYTADLVYANQSGALNEGFSDIWGTCIEIYGRTGTLNTAADSASPGSLAIWKIGEDCTTDGALRSMSYPLSQGQPDTYLGTSWFTGTGDNGGVHVNSGVLNHWFYIVTTGKSGTNNATPAFAYNVTGIGMTKSSQIAYYAERDYLTPNSTYLDARNATIAVASSLYCATSNEVQAVTKAWKAVNVGADYAGLTNDVSLKTISGGNTSVACGATYSPTITFENGGSANLTAVTIKYNIDGGTNSTIDWTGNLTSCSIAPQAISVSGLTRGFHTLNVTTTTAGDGNTTNNTKSIIITVNDNGTVNTVNTFNATTDALVSIDSNGKTNSIWQRGAVAKTLLTNTIAGSQVYATKLTGNYPDATTSYLVSQCYDLSNVSNPSVNFDMAFDLEEDYDFITFDYSTDSGATWNILGSAADANWYNSSRTPGTDVCESCPGKQWTGLYNTAPATNSNGMNGNKRNYSHTLSQFGLGGATPAANIIFRFAFNADGGVNAEGAFIDNFVVQGVLSRNENQFEQFAIYPNPSTGKFNIVLSTTDKVNVQLFDMRGRSVYNKQYNSTGISFNQQIDLSSLSSGVYILNVESNGKKEVKRIIIE